MNDPDYRRLAHEYRAEQLARSACAARLRRRQRAGRESLRIWLRRDAYRGVHEGRPHAFLLARPAGRD